MISTNKIFALYYKQMKNLLFNVFVLVGLFVPVAMAFLLMTSMTNTGDILSIAVLMNIVMGGMNTTCCLIAEEKEKKTLNVLITSTVTAGDFLLSNALVTLTLIMSVNLFIYCLVGSTGISLVTFMLLTTLCSIPSTVVGAIIGMISKSQMSASAMVMPVLMLLLFGPMFFSDLFVFRLTFAYQMMMILTELLEGSITFSRMIIVVVNLILLATVFAVLYKVKGLGE